jgi:hypothetical protein
MSPDDIDPMPFIDVGPDDDEVAAAAQTFCGAPGTFEIVVAGVTLRKDEDGITVDGKPLTDLTAEEKRAMVDAARAHQKIAAASMTAEDITDPRKNPFIKLGPGEG